MERFLYYWITISVNKYSTNPHGLLKLIPMAKCTVVYVMQLSWCYVLPPTRVSTWSDHHTSSQEVYMATQSKFSVSHSIPAYLHICCQHKIHHYSIFFLYTAHTWWGCQLTYAWVCQKVIVLQLIRLASAFLISSQHFWFQIEDTGCEAWITKK